MQQIILALLAICLAAGCTTTRTVHSLSHDSADRIESGQRAVVEYMDGSTEKVEIRHYGEEGIEVLAGDDTLQTIDYADIRAVHARRFDGRKTAGAIAAALLAVGLVSALSDIPPGFPSGGPAL